MHRMSKSTNLSKKLDDYIPVEQDEKSWKQLAHDLMWGNISEARRKNIIADMQQLMENNIPVDYEALHDLACSDNHVDVMRLILEHYAINLYEEAGEKTTLHHALEHSSYKMISLLFEFGASTALAREIISSWFFPNTVTSLIIRAEDDRKNDMVKAINTSNVHTLNRLLSWGDKSYYDLLLFKIDKRPSTALPYAILIGSADAVVWLLKHGGERFDGKILGVSPFEYALQCGQTSVVLAMIKAFEIDINKKYGKNGLTAIQLAALYDAPDLVLALQKAGANLDFKDENGQTVLFIQVLKGRQHVVEALLTAGAASELINNDGKTPFESTTSAIIKQALIYHKLKRNLVLPNEKIDDYLEKTIPPSCPPLWSYVLSVARTEPDPSKALEILEEVKPTASAVQSTLLKAYMHKFGFKHAIENEIAEQTKNRDLKRK